MMLVDRILLVQVHLEELVMLTTLEVLVADPNVSPDQVRTFERFGRRMTYEFNFWKFALIKSFSVISMNASSLPSTGMKYRLLSRGP